MIDPGQQGHPDKYEILQECRTLLTRSLQTIYRDAGITDSEALSTGLVATAEAFDAQASSTRRSGFEEADGLTASRISLVGESELELEIQLGDMSRRLAEHLGEPIRKVYLRFVTLYNRPDFAKEELPVGIEVITEGLKALLPALGYNAERASALLEHLETCFENQLPALYSQISDILDSHDVKPAIAKIQNTSINKAPAQAPDVTSLIALQTALLSKQVGALSPESPTATPFNASPEALTQLFARLESVLSQTAERLEATGVFNAEALKTLDAQNGATGTSRLPKAKELGVPMTSAEAALIDTVGLIFSAILDLPGLPEIIKSAISNLQITVLKVAVLDLSFLTSASHPAKQFIDELAGAAKYIEYDSGLDNPLCQAILQIAHKVRSDYHADLQVFTDGIAALQALFEQEKNAIAERAKPYAALLETLEKKEAARAKAETTAEAMITASTHEAIASFIRRDWVRVLTVIAMEQGAESQTWQNALNIVQYLQWSVQPMQNPDDRKRLAELVPKILQGVNAGFDRIDISKEDRDAFLDICFTLQTAALRGQPIPQQPKSTTQVDFDPTEFSGTSSPAVHPEVEEIDENGLHITLWRGKNIADPLGASGEVCRPGDWLAITLPDGSPAFAMACAANSHDHNVLLMNSHWTFALVMSPNVLRNQFRSKQARRVGKISLFDDAVQAALQNA